MKVGKFCFYIEIVLSKKAEKNERKRCKLCKIDLNKTRNTNKNMFQRDQILISRSMEITEFGYSSK